MGKQVTVYAKGCTNPFRHLAGKDKSLETESEIDFERAEKSIVATFLMVVKKCLTGSNSREGFLGLQFTTAHLILLRRLHVRSVPSASHFLQLSPTSRPTPSRGPAVQTHQPFRRHFTSNLQRRGIGTTYSVMRGAYSCKHTKIWTYNLGQAKLHS